MCLLYVCLIVDVCVFVVMLFGLYVCALVSCFASGFVSCCSLLTFVLNMFCCCCLFVFVCFVLCC